MKQILKHKKIAEDDWDSDTISEEKLERLKKRAKEFDENIKIKKYTRKDIGF